MNDSNNGFAGFATTIGNAKDFSKIDLAKINRMYGCSERYLTSSQPRAQVVIDYRISEGITCFFPNGFLKQTYQLGEKKID